jgi:hypothetical protein
MQLRKIVGLARLKKSIIQCWTIKYSKELFDIIMSGEVIRKLGYQHKQVTGFILKIE